MPFFTRFQIGLILGVSLLVLLSGCARTDADETDHSSPDIHANSAITPEPFLPDKQAWPQDVSDIAPDPRVIYGRLKNGLRYAILPVEDNSGTLSIQLNVAAGFNQEPEQAYGVAHLLEHIAFRGTREDKDASLLHELQEGGVGFGAGLNGFTSEDNTHYVINLSSSDGTSVKDALASLKTLIDVTALTQENMDAEKRVVLAELKRRDTVFARASRSYRAFEYRNNPRVAIDGTGTEDSLQAITLSQVEQFKAKHYRPEKALLVIAGGVDLKDAEKDIDAIFSGWRAGPRPKKKGSQDIARADVENDGASFLDPRSSRSLVALERRPPTRLPDSLESRKRGFTDRMVNAMLENRIDRRVTAEAENKITFINLIQTRAKANDLIGVRLSARDLPLAMTIFEEERRKALAFGFTPEDIEYEIIKKRLPVTRRNRTPDTITARSAASKMRLNFINGQVYTSARQEAAIFDEMTAELTAEDYNLAFRETWSEFEPEFWTQSRKPMSKTIEAVKAARLEAGGLALNAPNAPSITGFEKAEFDGSGKIKSRDVHPVDKTRRLLFENGVRLNYKSGDDDPGEILIAVNLRDPTGELVDTDYAAIAEKVKSLSRADIKGESKERMDRQFVGADTNFYVFTDEDRLTLSVPTTPESLQDALDLMSTFLTSFDLLSKDYPKKFKSQIDNLKRNSGQSPVLDGVTKIPFAYSGKSNARRSMTAQSYVLDPKINAHIDRILKTASIEVGVVGDFDADTLEAAVASSFGAMPTRPDVKAELVQENRTVSLIEPGISTLTYSGSDDQMAMFYCHPEDEATSDPKNSDRLLLSEIVRQRLFESLRADLGISYSPGVFRSANRVFPNAGFTCLYAQLDPANEKPAHDSFRNVISSFQDTPITASELKRARAPLLAEAERVQAGKYFRSQFVSRSYSEPGLSKRYRGRIKKIETTKLKELNARARGIYDVSRFHVFRVQHYQSSRAINQNNLEIESYLGYSESQLKIGERLLRSPNEADRERGVEALKLAGAQGLSEAYALLGQYYFARLEKQAAAEAFELSGPTDESAYPLGLLYFENFDLFPDVEDAHIMKILKQSAQSGDAKGQYLLAERLKDGTLIPRDEIGALKWALISNYGTRGVLSIDDERGIARFMTGVPEADIEAAQAQAESWIAEQQK